MGGVLTHSYKYLRPRSARSFCEQAEWYYSTGNRIRPYVITYRRMVIDPTTKKFKFETGEPISETHTTEIMQSVVDFVRECVSYEESMRKKFGVVSNYAIAR